MDLSPVSDVVGNGVVLKGRLLPRGVKSFIFLALQRRLDVVIWQHVLHFYNILAAIISEGSPTWSPMSRRTGGNTIYGDAMNGCT